MDSAEKAIKAYRRLYSSSGGNRVVPNPGFLVKKIPTWKLTVRDWSSDEFKEQVASLFDQLNEVWDRIRIFMRSNMDGFRRSWTTRTTRATERTRRTTRTR